MRILKLAAFALLGAIIFAAPSAKAAGIQSLKFETPQAATSNFLVPVHSRGQALDALYSRGYYKVLLVSKRIGYNGRPVYSFKACKHHKNFRLKVDWYGNIIHRRRAGFCAFRLQ